MKKHILFLLIAFTILSTSCAASSCKNNKYISYVKSFLEEVKEDFNEYN